MKIKNDTRRKLFILANSIILVLTIFIILARIPSAIEEKNVETPTPIIINTQINIPSPISNSMVIHITVVHWDQPGDIHTLLGNFNPAIGLTIRLINASTNNSNNVEDSSVTNINGLALLRLYYPIIDKNGNTQEVNIRIDGYSEIITCRINAYYPGYYSKEIFLEGNKIRTYYPR